MNNNALQFLRVKGLVDSDKTEFIISFEDGRKFELTQIIEEYEIKKNISGITEVAGRCFSCSHWKGNKKKYDSQELGECAFLSGTRTETTYGEDIYPETNKTGIESTPICYHDGIGFEYETRPWFCCVHFRREESLIEEKI